VERFQDTSLTVSSKLSSALTMDVYSSAGQVSSMVTSYFA